MEINRLKTFLVIAKNGSFKAAAELLFLSPRAVSKQMDQLENELGVKLFIRRHNNTDLTPTGTKFVIAAEDIVNTYNDELIRIQS
ncbi:LysR family transcriptional regulator, partial [Lactiplantibacillus plantarum]